MKKISVVFVLFFGIYMLSTVSCNSGDDDNVEVDVVDLLTTTGWVEQSLSFTESGVDVTPAYNTEYGDLSVNFNSNGTYSVVSEHHGILTAGTWVINDSKTVLTATGSDDSVFTLTIVSITNSELHLQFNYTSTGFINVDVDIDGTFVPAAG